MSKIFIIHGAFGSPNENWFPWLKKEQKALGHQVFVPRFPTPENQSLDSWEKVFNQYQEEIDEDTVFVGHSLGPAFILHILENLNVKIKAAFFASGFLGELGNKDFDQINQTFIAKDFDWEKIRKNCDNFFIYHSNNDPYVPLREAENLAKKLHVEPIIIEGAGHFNEAAGYTKFDKLLGDIKKTCQS